jgi:hypothetical protein
MARWWYDADIPFNASRSPYYQPMLDAIVACGKGFKGPSFHDLRGALLQNEVGSINEYLKSFKESWTKTDVPSCQMDALMEGLIPYLISLFLSHKELCF